ncbi:MAG: Zn-ribbon domain-containing OB-fold protein [Candidatus Jordarchaeum sp.]|uniref:Zn-ribbon domain-containing OB-fold protein n=1 Tax=Candidatus Jordarchaeum sp. TaxID=2823881 RepID=UPI00404A030E
MEDFSKFSAIKDSKVTKFIEGLKEGKIYYSKCRKCNVKYYPPVSDCRNCYSDDVEFLELNPVGELLTFTIIHYPPARFEKETPVSIGIIEAEGVKIMGNLFTKDPEGVKIGMKLKAIPKVYDDRITIILEKL